MSATPGPWRVVGPYPHGEYSVWSAGNSVISLQTPVFDDARLIAASWELYEALKHAVSIFEAMDFDSGDVDFMRYAIAKAEGKDEGVKS